MKFQVNITGGSYFEVYQPGTGLTVFTLGRLFHIDNSGFIVTAQGYRLLGPIVVPAPYNEALRVNEHGLVTALSSGTWIELGYIFAVRFEHPELLEDIGDGYYNPTIGSGTPVVGIAGEAGFEDVIIHFIQEAGKKRRPLAVLNIKNYRRMADFIARMRAISLNMAENASLFPLPSPPLSIFNSNTDALETAEAATETRTRGTVQARDQAYDLVLDNVHKLLNYVQDLADYADDEDDAKALIISSGFDMKESGGHIKEYLKVMHGEVSGCVVLIAKSAGKRSAYEWQASGTGTRWTYLPSTIQAKTKVCSLIPGTEVYFRFRPITKSGPGDWSQAVSIIVI